MPLGASPGRLFIYMPLFSVKKFHVGLDSVFRSCPDDSVFSAEVAREAVPGVPENDDMRRAAGVSKRLFVRRVDCRVSG